MIIDIILAVLLVLAAIKGYSKGLIVAVFSFVAIIVGLAAAMKLSVIAASYIGEATNISSEWLPFISFLAVFIGVIFLIRLGAAAIEKAVQIALMGWVNRLGGAVFFAAIYVIIYSVLLFYAVEMNLLKSSTIAQSATYDYIAPWGAKAINSIGILLPFFKDMFADLQHFFGGIASQQ
jgi:membrane protein required for colicin V production